MVLSKVSSRFPTLTFSLKKSDCSVLITQHVYGTLAITKIPVHPGTKRWLRSLSVEPSRTRFAFKMWSWWANDLYKQRNVWCCQVSSGNAKALKNNTQLMYKGHKRAWLSSSFTKNSHFLVFQQGVHMFPGDLSPLLVPSFLDMIDPSVQNPDKGTRNEYCSL